MADADPQLSVPEDFSGESQTRNRASLTFAQMKAMDRTIGDFFAEFRDGRDGRVAYEYARLEDFLPKIKDHYQTFARVPDDFIRDETTQLYLFCFAVIAFAISFERDDFIQLFDHTLVQVCDMSELHVWSGLYADVLDPDLAA